MPNQIWAQFRNTSKGAERLGPHKIKQSSACMSGVWFNHQPALRWTSGLPVSFRTASTAARPRSSLRQTMKRVAPRRASSRLVWYPRP